ncbi:MAG TPA: hypothetical protein VFH48_29185 [Chloroflexota bacterium]|nr:hypothetical protein [Chloroflexota bacterium]
MTDREFWIEVRRWLKTRILADTQMVATIEQRFAISDNGATKDRQSSAVGLPR